MSKSDRRGVSNTSRVGRAARVVRFGGASAISRISRRARAVAASEQRKQQLEVERRRRMGAELANVLGEMKGLSMKAGQQLSYRTQRPEGASDPLQGLWDDAPAMSPKAVAAVVERELGDAPERVFAWWDPEPIAAASVGQVHRARTADGRVVAVKVQYPSAQEALEADLENLGMVLNVARKATGAEGGAGGRLDPTKMAQYFKERILQETDYRREAANQERLGAAFSDHPFIHVPAVLSELSSERVLTTELAEGVRYSDVLCWDREQRDMAGEAIFRFHYRCMFEVGMHTADPHPGNYVFRKNGRVSFLDFGAVWSVPQGFNSAVEHLLDVVQHPGAITFAERTDAEHDSDVPFVLDEPGVRSGSGEGRAEPAPLPGRRPRDPAVHNAHRLRWLVEQMVLTGYRALPFPSGPPRGDCGSTVRVTLDEENASMAREFVTSASSSIDVLLAVQAVLATLGSQCPWDRIAREIWPWTHEAPATPLGRREADWARRR